MGFGAGHGSASRGAAWQRQIAQMRASRARQSSQNAAIANGTTTQARRRTFSEMLDSARTEAINQISHDVQRAMNNPREVMRNPVNVALETVFGAAQAAMGEAIDWGSQEIVHQSLDLLESVENQVEQYVINLTQSSLSSLLGTESGSSSQPRLRGICRDSGPMHDPDPLPDEIIEEVGHFLFSEEAGLDSVTYGGGLHCITVLATAY